MSKYSFKPEDFSLVGRTFIIEKYGVRRHFGVAMSDFGGIKDSKRIENQKNRLAKHFNSEPKSFFDGIKKKK